MDMLVHNIDPVFFHIGPLEIRYYGLVYVFSFLLMYFIVRKNHKRLNLSKDAVDSLVMYAFIGMLIGARLFHFLFSDMLTLLRNPLELFMIWHGGMSFFGGLIGGALAVYLFTRKHKINFYQLDMLVIPITLILVIGRFANFINGEIVGTITNLPWCFYFPGYAGCRHPYQLYASFSHLILFFILLIGKKVKQKGFLFWLFVTGYSGIRFITDFLRDEPRFISLTVWQYFCILGFIVGLYFIIRILRKRTVS